MIRITLLVLLLSISLVGQSNFKDLKDDFQIGIYALQPKPGTRGHQKGTLNEIKDDIEKVKGLINAVIPYRNWNRADYPSWNYSGYVENFIKEMFSRTYSPYKNDLIQAFTPPLYSSFINPPVTTVPENDRQVDRSLDIGLFNNFIETLLREEINFVFDFVKGDTSKFLEIMLDRKKRPLGGWYLDDEPLIRNHDIEVIESMSKIIRLIEMKIYFENPILRNSGFNSFVDYKQDRYLAFDSDDLHNYHLSGRKEDAKFYYYNGSPKRLKKDKIYSVFKEGTYEVLMLDFYHDDIFFWNNILLEAKYEFHSQNRPIPQIMPIIKGFKRDVDSEMIDYRALINLLSKYEISGLWIYSWIDSFDKTIDLKENWNKRDNNLRESILDLKGRK